LLYYKTTDWLFSIVEIQNGKNKQKTGLQLKRQPNNIVVFSLSELRRHFLTMSFQNKQSSN